MSLSVKAHIWNPAPQEGNNQGQMWWLHTDFEHSLGIRVRCGGYTLTLNTAWATCGIERVREGRRKRFKCMISRINY